MGKPTRFLLVFALFWTAITGLFDAFCAYSLVGQARSLGFRPAPGRILASEVTTHSDGDGTTYGARVRYEYRVDGRRYEADRVRFGQMSSSGGKWARETVAAFPAGAERTIHYDPADPATAVLQTGIDGMNLFLALFLTPFNAVALGLWATLWLGWRPAPVAGGVRLASAEHRVEAWLDDFPSWGGALAGAGLMAFALIFLIAFTSGFNPPLALMLPAWSLVLGAGLAGFLLNRRRLRTAPPSLVIDAAQGTLTRLRSPARPGQPASWKSWRAGASAEPPLVIPLERIRGIEVQERTTTSGDSTSHEFVVTARVAGTDPAATEQAHDLGSWALGNRAEAFALWLRGMLGLPDRAGR